MSFLRGFRSSGPGIINSMSGFNSLKIQNRNSVTLASVTSHSIVTQAFLDARQPKKVRKLKAFYGVPPADLPAHFHEKLDGANANPRSILKLGNSFGFNSFWSSKDRQTMQSTQKFKELVYDIVERKDEIHARKAPRILYSMAALEYRAHLLIEPVLALIDANIQSYTPAALAQIALSLAHLGIGGGVNGEKGLNQFSLDDGSLSKDFSSLVARCVARAVELDIEGQASRGQGGLLPADWAGMAYALTVFGEYAPTSVENGEILIPHCLKRACETAGPEMKRAGWARYFTYQTLYCTDVEKPSNEVAIKRAVPLPVQQELHADWLDDIVLHAQPQGSETLQMEVDAALAKLKIRDALVNCSAGRSFDEQHCWFAGHLIKSRDLAIEYDHLHPLGPGRFRPSGHVQLKTRMLKAFGLNVATVHKAVWDSLEADQKDFMAARVVAAFPLLRKPDVVEKPSFQEDRNLKSTAKTQAQKWPIEVYVKY